MERLGYTGTRAGMTPEQMDAVKDLLLELRPKEVHHGMCKGGDCEFEGIAREVLGGDLVVVGHPGVDRQGASPSRGICSPDVTREPLFYHDRDFEIVRQTEMLVGCPKMDARVKRGSGTWYTIQFAELLPSPVIIVFRDGTVRRDPEKLTAKTP